MLYILLQKFGWCSCYTCLMSKVKPCHFQRRNRSNVCYLIRTFTFSTVPVNLYAFCLSNFLTVSICAAPGLYCCDRAEEAHCQTACKRILRTMNTEHEIMEGLIEECGSQPLPQDPLWQCFLGSAHPPTKTDPETSPTAKMDCAKLHCCSKANTSQCRSAHSHIFSKLGFD